MALKKTVDKIEDVEESLRSFYKEANGKFVLDVEGSEDGRLDEFRNNNRKLFTENEDLKKKLGMYEGIDPDEARKAKDVALKVKKKELIEAGEFEKLIEAQLAPIKKEFSDKIGNLENTNRRLMEEKKQLLIDNNISSLASKHGAVPTAIRDITRDARELFSLNEQNEMVAMNPDGTIKRDANGEPITPESWMKTLPKETPHRFAPSSGGGSSETRLPMEPGKISARDNTAFLKNLDGIAEGKVLVAKD